MTIRTACIGLFFGLAPAALRAEPDYIGAKDLGAADLVKYWQLQVPLSGSQTLQRAYRVDDQLYLGTSDGYVFAVHAPTGALRWVQPVTAAGYAVPRPCHMGERAVFVLPSEIRILDRQFGDPLARRELEFPAGSAAAADDVRIFVGGLDRRIYAFDSSNLFEQWKVLTSAQITSTPAIFADFLFVASEDGRIHACNRKNKRFMWQAATYAPVTADLLAASDGVYVASRDHSLYLLDLLYGQVRWRARLSGPLYEPPVVTRNAAYQFSPRDGVVAINNAVLEEDAKRIRWKLPEGRSALTDDEQRAYVLTLDETIAVIDRESGEVQHRIRAAGFRLPMPDPENVSLIVASADGRLFCARPADAPYVRAEEVQAALRRKPVAEEAASAPTDARDATEPEQAESRAISARKLGGPAPGGRSKVSRSYGRGGGAP